MKRRQPKSLLVDAAWMLGAAAFACGLVGLSVSLLAHERAGVDGLRASLELKEALVSSEHKAIVNRAELTASLAQISTAQLMVMSDAQRGVALSKAARDAGVDLVQIRSGRDAVLPESGIVSASQELSVVGGYRQIAAFLNALYSSEGIVSVDSVQIESDGAGRQTASLEVAWFGLDMRAFEWGGSAAVASDSSDHGGGR